MRFHESIFGANEGRPSSKCNPRVNTCLDNVERSTCFVKMSDVLSDPGILDNTKSPDRTRSWTHRSAVARCRIRPSPRRRHMPTAAVASVWILRVQEKPRSLAMVCSPIEVDAPRQIPFSSASAELRVTVVWVVLQCLGDEHHDDRHHHKPTGVSTSTHRNRYPPRSQVDQRWIERETATLVSEPQ